MRTGVISRLKRSIRQRSLLHYFSLPVVVILTVTLNVSLVSGEPATPHSLADLIALAEQHSPVILAARHAVAGAEIELAKARAKWVSSVAVTMKITAANAEQGPTTSATGILTVQRSILNEYALEVTVAAANLREKQATLQASQQKVALKVGQAYVGLLLALRTEAINETTVRLNDEIIAKLRGKTDVKEAELLVAENGKANAESELLAARNEVELSRVALNTAIGLPTLQVNPAPLPVSLPPVPKALAVERPEVAAAQAKVDAAKASLDLALLKVGGVPTLKTDAALKVPQSGSLAWQVDITFSVSLSDRAQKAAEAEVARAKHEAALAELKGIQLDVESEARQASMNYRAKFAAIPLLTTVVTNTEKLVNLESDVAKIKKQIELQKAILGLSKAEAETWKVFLALRHALGRPVSTDPL